MKSPSATTARSKRCIGLRRPRTPLEYQIGSAQESDQKCAVNSAVIVLERHLHILQLIIRRNKNQHRLQAFYKYLSLLRNALRRLLIVQKALVGTTAAKPAKADDVRRGFEREAELRSQRDFIEEHISQVLVPTCYVVFSALVGDSQFANLGLVLVDLLADIAAGEHGVGLPAADKASSLFEIKASAQIADNEEDPGIQSSWLVGQSTRATGEDMGEVIERKYEHGQDALQADQQEDADKNDVEDFGHETVDAQTQKADAETPETATSTNIDQMVTSTKLVGPQTEEKQRKSKKKKSKIDDLFSGLF